MDFNAWSPVIQSILMFAMFLGEVGRRFDQDHPVVRDPAFGRPGAVYDRASRGDATNSIRNKALDEGTLRSIYVLALSFLAIFALSTFVILLDAIRTGVPLSNLEAMSVAMATLGNIGRDSTSSDRWAAISCSPHRRTLNNI